MRSKTHGVLHDEARNPCLYRVIRAIVNTPHTPCAMAVQATRLTNTLVRPDMKGNKSNIRIP